MPLHFHPVGPQLGGQLGLDLGRPRPGHIPGILGAEVALALPLAVDGRLVRSVRVLGPIRFAAGHSPVLGQIHVPVIDSGPVRPGALGKDGVKV